MRHPRILLGFAALAPLFAPPASAEPLYTTEGTDPPFATVQEKSGGKVGDRFNQGGALGSRVRVDHEALQKQAGKAGPIPDAIHIHTQFSGSIPRKDFAQWTRWYQEDGNVQVFRLFKGEQNVRNGDGKDGSPGRVEAFTVPALTVAPGTWREYEATYTIVKPVAACIFQLMHAGNDDKGTPLLWPVHVDMGGNGEVVVLRRRPAAGEEKRVVIAENMTGKSFSLRVRANGEAYEVYHKPATGDGPWKLAAKGTYAKAKANQISFRWGMYCGSKKGQTVPNDGLLFVTGVAVK
ncbi:MAG TPA: hypothetical protein VF796_23800 [Humisphaera sp.]